MTMVSQMDNNQLKSYIADLEKRYADFKAQNLKLDMSRGKPCNEQLDLAMDMFKCVDYKAQDGTDCRNYGVLDGLPEAKELFSKVLEVKPTEVIVGGNSSLNMMYDTIARAMSFGVYGSDTPWGKLQKVKFLCPSPGYDRHFAICELFGIEMIVIKMNSNGPDMDAIEKLVAEDDSIKGIWCVPKYSNPEGTTYSDEVVERFAKMKTKAKDFRIFWDNAYTVHHLSDDKDKLKNIMDECKKAGTEDRVFIYSSTSKISLSGAGVAMMAASENNLKLIKKQMGIQTIGPDKMSQLRHVKYFKSFEGIEAHMKKHADILKPKFDIVLEIMKRELSGKGVASWNEPKGGYFISLNTMEGCAKEVVSMAKEAGVVFTGAGATFPYGKDPLDSNIRVAPTLPPLDELKKAIEVLCICVQLAGARKLLKA